MSDNKQKNTIFQKALNLSSALIDAQLAKAKNSLTAESGFNFGKAVTKDRSYQISSQGFQEKPGAIGYEFQRQMAVKSSIVAAIIKTRQNMVSSFAQSSGEENSKGFRIVIKNKQAAMQKLREELFPEDDDDKTKTSTNNSENLISDIKKAEPEEDASQIDSETLQSFGGDAPSAPELSEKDKNRILKEELEKRTAKKRQMITEFILNCGETKDRPFDTTRWNFTSYLKAIVWDTLVYDQVATELVPKEAASLNNRMNIHHFYPVDGATIRYASSDLKKYKDQDLTSNQDILYPEEELESLEETDALELDDDRLDKNEYKYVQVIKGRIQRAFVQEELALGIRNPITDIYANGYGLSELELLTALVSSHLHTEYYNRAYFINGFSAKGILHIKANLNRSKLEELRRHWNHMVKGNRNSFQTPIMSGMEEIQWIPLTQNHSEMEFNLWLNYLIKMICAIYQIDPSEIGYGMKDEGGAGMSGDNTAEKLTQSKDKGLVPLMTFISEYVNKNIIDVIDPDYKLEWVGLIEETAGDRLNRQKEEVACKKTINEIREEDGLPPLPGCDNLVLNPVYIQWFAQFSEEAKEMSAQEQAVEQANSDPQQDPDEQWEQGEVGKDNENQRQIELEQAKGDINAENNVEKSLTIEVYNFPDNDEKL